MTEMPEIDHQKLHPKIFEVGFAYGRQGYNKCVHREALKYFYKCSYEFESPKWYAFKHGLLDGYDYEKENDCTIK